MMYAFIALALALIMLLWNFEVGSPVSKLVYSAGLVAGGAGIFITAPLLACGAAVVLSVAFGYIHFDLQGTLCHFERGGYGRDAKYRFYRSNRWKLLSAVGAVASAVVAGMLAGAL